MKDGWRRPYELSLRGFLQIMKLGDGYLHPPTFQAIRVDKEGEVFPCDLCLEHHWLDSRYPVSCGRNCSPNQPCLDR